MMAAGAEEYSEVLVRLNSLGLPTEFTQTGGMNAALLVQLETGDTLLITDAEDSLSWRRSDQRGWGVGLYGSGVEADDGPKLFASTERTSIDDLLRLLDEVLRPRT